MRGLFFAIASGALLLLATGATATRDDVARAIRVERWAAADSVTVGQRLYVSYAATYPESLTLLPPEQFDTGNCRLVSVEWRDRSDAGARIKQADLVVLPVGLENAHLPAAPFFFLLPAGDTLIAFSDEIDIPIRQLTGAESEPQPLKPQWEAPASYLIHLLIGGLVLLAAIALWLWLRWRKKRPVIEAPEPELPADYVALKALAEIERMDLLKGGRYKRYYTLVIDVVRHYLERRYGVQTMDRTTDEILSDLDSRRSRVDGLEPLLREADLVKFAKYKPEIFVGKRAMQTARDIVVQTTPRPVAAAAGG
jgi:hypothetical protein